MNDRPLSIEIVRSCIWGFPSKLHDLLRKGAHNHVTWITADEA